MGKRQLYKRFFCLSEMELKVLKEEKQDIELQIDNITIAELLRVYLYEQGAAFAAWRREHPTKPLVLKVSANSGSASKLIGDAVAAVQKDLDSLQKVLKK